jgi:hypothetical protein
MYSSYQAIQYANDRQRELWEQAARDRLVRELKAPARAARRAARKGRLHRTWRMALRLSTQAPA